MNERPTINWKWNAEHGILNIISSGDGYYVLLEVDDKIFEAGEDKALCSIKSAVGNTHQARACISKNGSIVSEWAESTYLVPQAGSSRNESEPNDSGNNRDSDYNGSDSDNIGGGGGAKQSSKPIKYPEIKSLLENAIVATLLQMPANEVFEDEGKNESPIDERISERVFSILLDCIQECLKNEDTLSYPNEYILQTYADVIAHNDNVYGALNDVHDEEFQQIIKGIKNLYKIYADSAKNLKGQENITLHQIREAITAEKEKWITFQLENYFKKWYIGDSGFTLPYHMKIVKNDTIEKLFNENKNEIGSPLLLFDLTIDIEFDFQDYNITDETLLGGKGYPELLQTVAWLLNEKNPINDSIIDALLKKMDVNKIGVDCSGFVTRALAHIFTALKKQYKDQKESLEVKSVKAKDGQNLALRTSVSHYNDNENPKYTKDNMKNFKEHSVEPKRIRPGDFIIKDKEWDDKKGEYNVGHVKIISEVKREGNIIEFTTMESSSTPLVQTSIFSDTTIKKTGVIKKENRLEDNNNDKSIKLGTDNYEVVRVPIIEQFYGIATDMCSKEKKQ